MQQTKEGAPKSSYGSFYETHNIKAFTYDDLPDVFRELYESGFINIIPIEEKTKKPFKIKWKQYQAKQYPISKLKWHRGNFALITGQFLGNKKGCIAAVDLDDPKLHRHFKHEDTLQQKTARKGHQLFYITPKETNAKGYFRKYYDLDIDILGSRSTYTIIPPSYIEYYNKNQELEHTGNHKLISPGAPGDIILKKVPNILKHVESILKAAGFKRKETRQPSIKEETEERERELLNLLKEVKPKKGSRQDYALCLAGTLKQKVGLPESAARKIFKEVFKEDEELSQRVGAVESTYHKNNDNLQGWGKFKQFLTGLQQEEFLKITSSNVNDLRSRIITKRLSFKMPSVIELADFLNMNLDLYKDLDTLKYYEKTKEGSIIEIDSRRVVKFFNKEFGENKISHKKADAVLKEVTAPITKDYNLLEFTNGVLNTETKEFKEGKRDLKKIPKISFPFKWNSGAEGGKIKEIIEQTLTHKDHPDNLELWLRAVGHAFLGINKIGKHVITVGPSKTGKSTLNTILEKVFNCSHIPISVICKNERFTLYPMIGKDINIDDDANNGLIKDIGFLNTVVTGNTIEVEVKGENKRIKATNPQMPVLFSSGNSLPPVIGEGFETRLLLIHAKNVVKHADRMETLQSDILNGEYDHDLEWLVYTALNLYWKMEDQPLTTEETEKQNTKYYEMMSYPLKVAIEELFEESYSELDDHNDTIEGDYKADYLTVRDVNRILKIKLKTWYKEGKISSSHKSPSTSLIKKTMDRAGYEQGIIKVWEANEDTEFYKTSKRVYLDIKAKHAF